MEAKNAREWSLKWRVIIYLVWGMLTFVAPISLPIYAVLHAFALGFLFGQLWQWKGLAQDWLVMVGCIVYFVWLSFYKVSINSVYFGY